MSDKLHQAAAEVSSHMDQILRLFKPGRKITVIVRTPGNGEADFLMTDDDLDEVVGLVQRHQAQEAAARG